MKEFSNAARQVTIRDLARELGMSDRSVSQALNPRKSNVQLNPETAKRICLLAKKRNYRPHTSARAMRSGRFFNIGYFEAKQHSTSMPLRGAEDGICDGATRHGYRVVLIKIPTDVSAEKNPIPFVFREAHLDALVVSNVGRLSPECKEAIDASGLPVVYLNEKRAKNAVYVEDIAGMRTMTEHLIERGHRKIFFLGTASFVKVDPRFEHYSVQDRIVGYESAMAAAGLRSEVLRFSPDWVNEFGDWYRENRSIDALVCPGDLTALRLFRRLYSDQVWVPQDLALTGYGNDFPLECPTPLTTMEIPFYEMGMASVDMALRLVNEGQASIPSVGFHPELIVRESSLFPPAKAKRPR